MLSWKPTILKIEIAKMARPGGFEPLTLCSGGTRKAHTVCLAVFNILDKSYRYSELSARRLYRMVSRYTEFLEKAV